MPIFIPDLFTGYINGRRAAIKDNWKDAENYNSVMKGQLDNAIAMQTMADTARKSNASANVADMNQTIAGARTDNELDLLMKQRANNLNALKAQLEAIQTQFNIDLTKSDEYKKLMLGQAQLLAGQTGQTGQTNSSTATTTIVPNSTTVQLTQDQLDRINALNLSQDDLNQFNTYLGGAGSTADVDAAIANMQRLAQEKQNRDVFSSLSLEEQQALLSLPDAQKQAFSNMTPDQRKAFLNMTPAERDALLSGQH